jgi:hypothetical protein
MRYLVQTRIADECEESYVTVAAPEDPRVAVAIAKYLRVPDPLNPDGELLRKAIVIDEETEEECFDGIRRAEHQLGGFDPALPLRLAEIGERLAAEVSEEDMRIVVHPHSWPAVGLEAEEESSDG